MTAQDIVCILFLIAIVGWVTFSLRRITRQVPKRSKRKPRARRQLKSQP